MQIGNLPTWVAPLSDPLVLVLISRHNLGGFFKEKGLEMTDLVSH